MEAETPITTDPALSPGSHQTETDKCSGLHRSYHFDTYMPEIKSSAIYSAADKG